MWECWECLGVHVCEAHVRECPQWAINFTPSIDKWNGKWHPATTTTTTTLVVVLIAAPLFLLSYPTCVGYPHHIFSIWTPFITSVLCNWADKSNRKVSERRHLLPRQRKEESTSNMKNIMNNSKLYWLHLNVKWVIHFCSIKIMSYNLSYNGPQCLQCITILQ